MEGSTQDSWEQKRNPSVSTLQMSLLSGLQPASSTDNLLLCPTDNEDNEEEEVKGTGVHAVMELNEEYDIRTKEIGKRTKRRNEWEETIGLGSTRPCPRPQLQTTGNQLGPSSEQPINRLPETRADTTPDHPGETGQAEQLEDLTNEEPSSFQAAILHMYQPHSQASQRVLQHHEAPTG